MPPLHRTPLGQERDHPPSSSRDNQSHPGSDVIFQEFRCVIGRFAFAHLRSAHLTGVSPPFTATLKTPALYRRPLQRFVTPPSQSWSRRARGQKPLPPSLVQHCFGSPPPHSRHTLVLLFRTSACDELAPPLHRVPPGQPAGRPLAEGTPKWRAFVPRTMRLLGFGTVDPSIDASGSGSLTFVFSLLT
jgi:hypothetical protein